MPYSDTADWLKGLAEGLSSAQQSYGQATQQRKAQAAQDLEHAVLMRSPELGKAAFARYKAPDPLTGIIHKAMGWKDDTAETEGKAIEAYIERLRKQDEAAAEKLEAETKKLANEPRMKEKQELRDQLKVGTLTTAGLKRLNEMEAEDNPAFDTTGGWENFGGDPADLAPLAPSSQIPPTSSIQLSVMPPEGALGPQADPEPFYKEPPPNEATLKAQRLGTPASKAQIGTARALAMKAGPDAVKAFMALGDAPTLGELETITEMLEPAITATTAANALQARKDEAAGRKFYLGERLKLDRQRLDASIRTSEANRKAAMERLAVAVNAAKDRDKQRLSVVYGALKTLDTRIASAERAARQAHQNWTVASYKAAEHGKENDPEVEKLFKSLQAAQGNLRTLYGQRRDAVKRLGLQDAGIDVAGFDLSEVGASEVADTDWQAVIDATQDYNNQGVLGD